MPQFEHYPLEGKNTEKEGKLRYQKQKQNRLQEDEFSQLVQNFQLTEWMDRALASREYDQARRSPTVSILSQVMHHVPTVHTIYYI